MISHKDLTKLRHLLIAIQQGTAPFSSAFAFLDTLQGRNGSEQQADGVQQCVKPIRKILQTHKQSLNKLRENGESLMAALKEKSSSHCNHRNYTNQQLDSQINYLTSVLKSKRNIR